MHGTITEAIRNYFPLLTYTLNGVALWVWITLPVMLILLYVLVRLLVGMGYFFLCKIMGKDFLNKYYLLEIRHSITLLITAILFSALQALLPSRETEVPLQDLQIFLYALAISWLLYVLISHMTIHLQNYWMKQNKVSAAALIPLFRKIALFTVAIIALLFVLKNWGFDIASMLAALGIGGIALALASQKSIEHLFGGIMLSLDQPIRIDEVGKFGDIVGKVIDIGMRSTRIRTVQNTEVSIPNAQLASMAVENFSLRQQILFNKKIRVALTTGVEQVESLRSQIEKLLVGHEKIIHDSVRVRLEDFSDFAQVFDVFAYIDTSDWNYFMQLQEFFLLEIKKILLNVGAEFALPTQVIHLSDHTP